MKYHHKSLLQFSADLFESAGLERLRAITLANTFLEADFTGFLPLMA